MSATKGTLPPISDDGVQWKSLAEALRHMDYREQYFLQGTPEKIEEERARIEQYRAGIKSLSLISHEDYADFLRKHVESGGQIDTISGRYQSEFPITIFKTTQPLTVLPYSDGRFHLEVLVQRGHTLQKEKENDDCRVYDLNGNRPMPNLYLMRDTANIMLQKGWTPKEEHFGETCLRNEIDKLLARGKKLSRMHARVAHEKK